MNVISGWYETDGGVDVFDIDGYFDTTKDLAEAMYFQLSPDCIGVDLEIDGVLSDGTDIDVMLLIEELERLDADA